MLLKLSIEETSKAIRRLKNNKAPGNDGIAAELVKNGGAPLENEIRQIITEVWVNESIPCDWNYATQFIERVRIGPAVFDLCSIGV